MEILPLLFFAMRISIHTHFSIYNKSLTRLWTGHTRSSDMHFNYAALRVVRWEGE